ncbi:thiamine diphosphokinase [Piscibacillus halophilus]|uniref:Thiamine diphosphokinase n=1 Tax=Piscibacillus halophilus TaxID=571933 RepID=A0A1H8YVA7_9BACI|nr:thiamine diphosphokinase [Piscibacillus halophilus]SEP56027.1 thiamine diphosphokinase [Piscibacillus halophilus]
MSLHVGIVAAGPIDEIPDLSNYPKVNYWIGVDEGAKVLYEAGIQTDLVMGDFDSIDPSLIETLQQSAQSVKVFPTVKDETDLELAFLEAIHLKPDQVLIFGATGGRLDHAWMNVQLLNMFADQNINAWLVNGQNEITLKKPGKYELEKDLSFPYISFLPFSEKVENLTLQGFRYPLDQHTIVQGSSLTISNEWSEKKGTYFFTSGIILVIKSRD